MKCFFQGLASCAALAAAAVLWPVSQAVAQVSVTARFDPALIHAGDPTYYVIEIHNSQGQLSGDFPAVQGLRVTGREQNQFSTSIINGVSSSRRNVLIPMAADDAGTYTVPSFTVQVDGTAFTTPPAQLQVLPALAASDEGNAAANANAPLRMTLDVAEGPYYVGQAIPVRLVISAAPQISISGSSMPAKTGSDNYMLAPFVELSARRAQVGGQLVNQHASGTIVTPLSNGEMVLGFEQTLVAHIPQHLRSGAAPARQSNDPFARMFGGDAFFDRMLNREEVQLRTPPLTLQIEPLPADGRPSDFTGAIGEFRLGAATLSATEVKVGEPVTLTVAIEGSGNFERIQPPQLQDSAQWRSYTPQSRFRPQDALGLQGEKTFEYTLIARTADVTHTPAFSFSYFDPRQKQYVALPIPPLPLTVIPTADTFANAAQPQQPTGAPAAATQVDADLLPLMPPPLSDRSSPARLLITRPSFYAIQVLPAIALAGFVLYRRRQLRLVNDPMFARSTSARKQIAQSLRQARTAAAAADAPAFYAAAEQALKQSLTAAEPHIAAASLTLADVEQRLSARNTDASTREQVQRFFAEADALRYGGKGAAQAPLGSRCEELALLLQRLRPKGQARQKKSPQP